MAELEKFTEDIIIKHLSSEPELGDDIKEVINLIIEEYKGNVILDFSQVDIMTASSIGKLLKLRKITTDAGYRLIFYSLSSGTMDLIIHTGLEEIFQIEENKSCALATLK